MSDYDPEQRHAPRPSQIYAETGNIEAHIIADMLRIEGITTELREFKSDTKVTLRKFENYFVAIVGVTVTTLITSLGAVLFMLIS